MTKLKPILFSTQMVHAILEGRKTQTRRVIKSKHESGLFQISRMNGQVTAITSLDWDERPVNDRTNDIQPIARPGDILWVRETWQHSDDLDEPYLYKQQCQEDYLPEYFSRMRWKPSIFMPKEACRIFLKVTNVRVERLNEISDDDAEKEGIIFVRRAGGDGYGLREEWDYNFPLHERTAVGAFRELWLSINGARSWDKNPYVWVYEFERVEKPEAWP